MLSVIRHDNKIYDEVKVEKYPYQLPRLRLPRFERKLLLQALGAKWRDVSPPVARPCQTHQVLSNLNIF